MRTALASAVAAVALALSGCSGNGAEELLDTAKLEEKQNNVPHARKLYQQIVEQHPDSPQAKIAHERLAELKE